MNPLLFSNFAQNYSLLSNKQIISMENDRKLYIETYGCQMNVADSEVIAAIMGMEGYGIADSLDDADAVLLNTCSIRDNAEQKIVGRLQALRALQRDRKAHGKGLIIGVTGCMAERVKDDLVAKHGVDLVAGPDSYLDLPALFASAETGHPAGCNNFCSYCIVPYTRGRERSRPVDSILAEVADLRAKGYKEVTLLGQNVNSYNYTDPEGRAVGFAELLSRVAESAPDMRVRFTTSHPKDMGQETLEAIAAHPNICRWIHLPVQSGSNSVLKAMNRKYTREWYLDRIADIRATIPDCGITTDLFTGFHNESEEDFEQTLDLMRTVGFDASYMFKYSERPGTLASRTMPDNIPEDVKIDRLNRMIALQNELSLESNRRDIGQRFEVLVEGVAKRSKEQMVGRTSQNKTAVFARGNAHVGDTVTVEVVDATSATLLCKLV